MRVQAGQTPQATTTTTPIGDVGDRVTTLMKKVPRDYCSTPQLTGSRPQSLAAVKAVVLNTSTQGVTPLQPRSVIPSVRAAAAAA